MRSSPSHGPAHDLQPLLDRFLAYQAPSLDTLDPVNARHLPTLKNAAEDLTSEKISLRVAGLVKPLPEPVGQIHHLRIPTRHGEVLARVYRPASEARVLPVVVYFHGGGFVIANLDTYDPSCRALCNAAEAVIVSVAYRQAPESPYPAAPDDAEDALRWVLDHATELGGDPARVAVAGESAGGNLATVACLRNRARGGRQPVAQLLVYPVTNLASTSDAYVRHAQAIPLNAAMMAWFKQHYLPDPTLAHDADVSPLLCANLKGLPPACVINAELDPLADEGLAYAEALAAAGVAVTHRFHAGMTHEFFGLAGLVSEAKKAVTEAAEWLTGQFEAAVAAQDQAP